MQKKRVLYVFQEIMPYLPESHMSKIGRFLPQKIQESGKEIRVFMPRFGLVNERRNQLHEVIRLSGMNLIIEDIDHPLIIKVASIQQARMQVYFIENEDFFHRKFIFRDAKGKFFDDNDERTIFFSRGVLDTVKKLGWEPNIIHTNGWFSGLLPLYVRTLYKDNPLFSDSKIIVSLYNDGFEESFAPNFVEKIKAPGIPDKALQYYKEANYVSLMKSAIDFADAFIIGEDNINTEVLDYVQASGKPILEYQGDEDYFDAYNQFYDEILEKE
ncbi:glycogen/starch synthase [Candidatus Sulfidibacterium hydrothermale]|uniref:glycogen/starch synthase n=1 Tax=Candidatus Sulfidibacterium hydrothermale TaxID=2875962 RepID=UPI001F0ACCAF|nr:glycogen/starch synthase [Candidatus Sulfidibacterium hydrothermale]UBM62739.1 glycogen/starch synthase [Candidatus Sulfidibacterium hydrothermale]